MITVKIQCPCGTKFAFEADESLTLAAGVIACPNCGADAAAAANSQLAAARANQQPVSSQNPASRPVRLTVSPTPTKPANEAAAEEPPTPRPSHPPLPFSGAHKPTRSEKQIRRNREQAQRRRPYIAAAVVLMLALFVFWFWYQFSGSKPKTVMSTEYPRAERPLVPRLLANHQMLLIRNRDVSLLSAPNGKPLWQKSFGNVTNFDDSLPNYVEVDTRVDRPTPAVRIASNSFWIVWPDQVLDLNRETGEPAVSVKVPEDQPDIRLGEQLLMLEKTASTNNRITFDVYPLAGGAKQSLEIPSAPTNDLLEVVPDATSVVTVRIRLLESKIITNKLSTEPKVMTASGIKKSPNDNFDKIVENTHTAGQSLSAAVKLVHALNQRDAPPEPDETYEDQSRYEVEIQRVQGDTSSWKGEIIGRPEFFPLPTVDVIAGEKHFKVFDKSGQLKWEGPLSYPLSARAIRSAQFYRPDFRRAPGSRGHDDQNGLRYRFPFVESGDRLYAFDEGVLAAFDLKTGEVKWRVTSVGIHKIIFDRDGFLYACTTQAGPQTLKRPPKPEDDAPVDEIIKVDPRSGSVLWHAPYLGTDLYVSGKFIYSKWVGANILDQATALSANSETVPSCSLTRINPADGEVLWRREYKGDPDTLEARQTWLLIQFPRRIEVMRFFSF